LRRVPIESFRPREDLKIPKTPNRQDSASPSRKSGAGFRRRSFNKTIGYENRCLLVSFILNVLAGIFHVFTETMCRMAPGENNLAYNRDQETKGRSF
jgi:hypothetical protein